MHQDILGIPVDIYTHGFEFLKIKNFLLLFIIFLGTRLSIFERSNNEQKKIKNNFILSSAKLQADTYKLHIHKRI